MDFIAEPFGVMMKFLYEYLAFGNYGIAIILFTLLTRIILFPLTLKQQKSMKMTQQLQPKLEELKLNYGDDREKFAIEQQKLYNKYGVNPMAGCLPMLIQFPLILAIYQIVRQPLTYIMGFSSEMLTKLGEIAGTITNGTVDELATNSWFLGASESTLVEAGVSASDFINMNFLKIFDLGATPWQCISEKDWSLLPLLFIPILATGTTYISQWITNPNRKKKGKKEVQDQTQAATNMMLKLMPLMTLYFAFVLPAALGFYWFIGNLLSLVQTIIMNKVFMKKKEG